MREWVTTFLVALSDVGICTAQDALPLAADDDLMAAVLATSVDLFFDGYHLLNAIPAIRVFTSKDVGHEAMLRLWAQLDPALRRPPLPRAWRMGGASARSAGLVIPLRLSPPRRGVRSA